MSLRERRVRLYSYSDVGGQGLVSAKYTFREERWALVSQQRGSKTILGAAPNSKVDAVIDFDPSVTVNVNDLLVDGTDRYFARGSTLQRTPPARLVNAERISEEVFQQLVVSDWTASEAIDGAAYASSVVES